MLKYYKRWKLEARIKLPNTQLNKLKSAEKNNAGTTISITKNFQDEKLPNKFFLTTRQETKIRNVFAMDMLTDIKLSKEELSKITQLGGSLGKTIGNMMGKLGKNTLLYLAVPLAKYVLPKLGTKAISSALDKFEKELVERNRKSIDMHDIIFQEIIYLDKRLSVCDKYQ